MVGDQAQQSGAITQDLASVADTVNRSMIGVDPRKKREMMRLGESDPNSFAMLNPESTQQATMPSSTGGLSSLYDDSYLMDYYGLRNFKPTEGYTYKEAEYGYGPALAMPSEGSGYSTDENGIMKVNGYDYKFNQDGVIEAQNTLLKPTGYYDVNNNLYGNSLFGLNFGSAKDTRNFLAQDMLSGRDLTKDQYLNSIGSNEVIPNNPAYGQLYGLFDPIYGSDLEEQLLQYYGKSMGLSEDAIENVARGYAASGLLNSPNGSLEMGGGSGPTQTAQGLVDYAKHLGITPSQSTLSDLFAGAKNIQNQLGDARSVESSSGGMFTDALPIISTVLKFTPLAPVAYAYDAYNAMQNDDILGLGMAAFGGFGGFDALGAGTLEGPMPDGGNLGAQGFAGSVQGARDTLASTLGVPQDIASGILKGSITGLGNGGGLEGMIRGGLSGGVGNYAGGLINGLTREQFGDSIAKMAGGAASGGLNSLFNKNSPISGSLYGGMSGGLHGFLNSTNSNLTPEDSKFNQGLAQTVSKIAMKRIKK